MLCGCAKEVCKQCGKPRIPITHTNKITESTKISGYKKYFGQAIKEYRGTVAKNPSDLKRRILESMQKETKIVGYSKCNCNAGFKPGIVLDIFFGAGTTAVAAEELGLQWMGIELNPKYIEIAKKRLEQFLDDKLKVFC